MAALNACYPSSARISSVSLKSKVLQTPCFIFPTSKGTIPHLTPDNINDNELPVVYFGLEDSLDLLEKSPIFTAEGEIDKWVAGTSSQSILVAPRRSTPLPSVSAGSHHIQILTSSGLKKLTNEVYVKAIIKLRPEIAIPLNDNPSNAPGVKRKPKMTEKSITWTDELLSGLQNNQLTEKVKVFFPVPNVEAPYLDPLIERFRENDYKQHISGLACYGNLHSIPSELSVYPKIFLRPLLTPLAILQSIHQGADIVMADLVNQASDSGIAFTFAFPPPVEDLQNIKLELAWDMWNSIFAADLSPLQPGCSCNTCQSYSRAYIHHLLQTRELVGWIMIQQHNIHVFHNFFSGIRDSIKAGNFLHDTEIFKKIYSSNFPRATGLGPRKRGYQMDLTDVQPVENKPNWVQLKPETNNTEFSHTTQKKEKVQEFQESELPERDTTVGNFADTYAAISDDQSGSELEENLFAELDDIDDSTYRESRMQSLKEEFQRVSTAKEKGHMQYLTVENEREVMDITTSSKRVVIHFFHPDFRRCKIMDAHLEKISKSHWETKFVRIEAANAPFLALKLGLKVLPVILCYVDAKLVSKLTGFTDLGNNDDFDTPVLEFWLLKWAAIEKLKENNSLGKKSIMGFKDTKNESEDSDFE
ncbi:queuine tRNA-ribosyltransferase accessory subunit Qtrtd1/Qtr2 [Schizosaccharomyces osmophilus]|uniref:Queuine tRNA-ribosyltransferase accessory subunit 2 n=1 Tax=Schizosaccharomyces osmophilus TaxID=2545709 RepID=A0AAE9WEY5_9SCHI|nr:queuine tRNA-ribosyltransferase accessory subunit Qtrtd1/Qtr2 [Schizosaccharomyces osmophilus]WBW75045.1 queuine tRNA-ribosyltransferase accessory subunit Qtrtd1/Qtr2 [Schizosaccharomyces osmophilus]